MPDLLDLHGQPLNAAFNIARRRARDVSEMLGIAKGLIADGVINEAEARYLRDWGQNHPDAVELFPASLIFSRLKQFYADGHIDSDEREELRGILASLVGGDITINLGMDGAAAFPLDNPAPLICWHEEVYVFTGRFAYGTRKQCESEVLARGGLVDDGVTRRTTFLVIGTFSSRDWQQSSYGAKIVRAAQLRESGFPLRIVGEDHWANALTSAV
ncbi:MAG TPA: BRCT domain-containing protein [Vicinamibacterales bacterium]|nr:BRCT domain-containing protein [Vicinamibacterales bacterium]